MDIVTQRHLNRHTKDTDTLFVVHFQLQETFDKFICWLDEQGFVEIKQRANKTYSKNYFESGVSCVLYETQISMLVVFFLGKEFE